MDVIKEKKADRDRYRKTDRRKHKPTNNIQKDI